ncbi:uroporphyrinogen-III C-methyltransferase [Halomonas campisalis]|uniref:uroporphyrinogen-III C-methyltransferase n=1 Tax=Billgrantia campisalis TaxID=74661 RepID=A0ABS9PC06_9GAMM|nr:uroporphyrinogen-III C-methyltransferase [Halomonas campisalis]MCG6659315.1 uroporphyrinogen-III C-methyltransferase [Halomonas campisalis]MDR5863917.1 uroporphyrinogen-III C-methyltransferase [Halomonas campisalis]
MRALSQLKTLLSPERFQVQSPKALGQAALSRLHGLGHIVRSPFGGARRTPAPTVTLDGECRPGCVYLVGAGSGDVELLTLKAARLLQQADAVVYDRLVGDDVLALIPVGRERYYVGKERGHHSVPQAEIGALLVKLAGQGKSVVRLKGGDPGVFGRLGEELAALAEAGVEAEIVPGITAASAAAAGMGIPLTDRAHAQQLRFITAQLCRQDGEPDWATLARQDETLIFYMGLTKVDAICRGLRHAGLPDDWPIMLVANASLPEQASLVGTLADMPGKLAASPLPSPCLIVVGSVVRMVEQRPAALQTALGQEGEAPL